MSRSIASAVADPSRPAVRQRSNAVYFEYTGKTALTVKGPVTGAIYRFVSHGSRVAVDLRDHVHVAAVPGLARVGGARS